MKYVNPIQSRYTLEDDKEVQIYGCPADKSYALVTPNFAYMGDDVCRVSMFLVERYGSTEEGREFVSNITVNNKDDIPTFEDILVPAGARLIIRKVLGNSKLHIHTSGLEFMNGHLPESKLIRKSSIGIKYTDVSELKSIGSPEAIGELAINNPNNVTLLVGMVISDTPSNIADRNIINIVEILPGTGVIIENILLASGEDIHLRILNKAGYSVNSVMMLTNIGADNEARRIHSFTSSINTSDLTCITKNIDPSSNRRVTLNFQMDYIAGYKSFWSIYIANTDNGEQVTEEHVLYQNLAIVSPYINPEIDDIILGPGQHLFIRPDNSIDHNNPTNIRGVIENIDLFAESGLQILERKIITSKDPTIIYSLVGNSFDFAAGTLTVSGPHSSIPVSEPPLGPELDIPKPPAADPPLDIPKPPTDEPPLPDIPKPPAAEPPPPLRFEPIVKELSKQDNGLGVFEIMIGLGDDSEKVGIETLTLYREGEKVDQNLFNYNQYSPSFYIMWYRPDVEGTYKYHISSNQNISTGLSFQSETFVIDGGMIDRSPKKVRVDIVIENIADPVGSSITIPTHVVENKSIMLENIRLMPGYRIMLRSDVPGVKASFNGRVFKF